MYNQNIFETAAAVIQDLQKANWTDTPDGPAPEKPIDIASRVSSRDEAALAAQVVTRILHETPYFSKDGYLLVNVKEPERGADPADKSITLSISIPEGSDMGKFKADDSLSQQRASQSRISAAPPANLKDVVQHVRDGAAKEWSRSAQGDYYQTLAVSHGNAGETGLIYNEHNVYQVNAMLRSHPDNKERDLYEIPRIWVASDPRMQSTSPPVLMVRKEHAKQVLVDLLGLDAKKLAIPSAQSLE